MYHYIAVTQLSHLQPPPTPPLLYGTSYLRMQGATEVLMKLNIQLSLIFSRRLLIYDHPTNIFPTFLFDFIHLFILLYNIVNFNG